MDSTQTQDVQSPPENTTPNYPTNSPEFIRPPEIISDPAVRFRGLGTNFKAKIIGIDDVTDSRGDKMCQESVLKLKAAVRASGQHKQKVVINVSLEGIKIVDILSGEVHHVHPVHRISFISRDLTDRRAFGYVYGAGEGRHQFFGIKTAKVAEILVLALRDLFQVVYDMKKKEMEDAKTIKVNGAEEQKSEGVYAVPQKRAAQQATMPTGTQQQQSSGSLLDLEQQLTNIQEGINNIDSFSPWPQDLPTSPDTPFSPGGDGSNNDLFGIANLSDISSLSSDFSCASAVLDPNQGQLGGSEKGLSREEFVRSGSSRSAISWHGFKLGHGRIPTRSSSHSGRTQRLDSLVDSETKKQKTSPDTSPKYFKSTEISSTSSNKELSSGSANNLKNSSGAKSTSNASLNNGSTETIQSKNMNSNSGHSSTMEKTRDTLQSSTSVSSLPTTEKKSKSSFFSRSDKSKKEKEKTKNSSKKEKLKVKKEKSSKQKGSKSADEKPPVSRSKNTSSSSDLSNLSKKKATSSVEFPRRDSISSINSVQSCVVPSTIYGNIKTRQLSSSRTSLDKLKKTMKEVTTSPVKYAPSEQSPKTRSYIVQSSVRPRTRPRAKHTERVAEAESNPKNPPMFKSHSSVSVSENEKDSPDHKKKLETSDSDSVEKSKSEVKVESESFSSAPDQAWVASFETDFDNFKTTQKFNENESTGVDPFTGLESKDLKIPSSNSAVFDDTAWGPAAASENQPSDSERDKKLKTSDPFVEQSKIDFPTDPFARDAASPFVDDPFTQTEADYSLSDPLAPFDEKDFFGNSDFNKKSSPFQQKDFDQDPFKDVSIKQDAKLNVSQSSSNEPTFPSGIDIFTAHLKDNHNSADSSSLTSGMSTPIVASSPVHAVNTSPATTSSNLTVPPPLPPRLPPRPSKRSTGNDAPNVPPPPLPDICPSPLPEEIDDDMLFEELENLDISPPDYLPPELPEELPPSVEEESFPDSLEEVKEMKQPPAIPQRTHSRHSSQSSGLSAKESKVLNETPSINGEISERSSSQLGQYGKSCHILPLLPPPPSKKCRQRGDSNHPSTLYCNGISDSFSSISTHSSSSRSSPSDDRSSYFSCSSGNTAPNKPQDKAAYSDELFSLNSPVAQPAPQPGAKLTKDQILMGYGGAPQPGQGYGGAPQPGQGMFGGQPQMMRPPHQMPGQYGVQGQMGVPGYQPQMQAYGQPVASAPFGMFPPGPSPAIPPRPGAMRPPASQLVPGGALQNPFGDAAAASGAPGGGLLSPTSQLAANSGSDTTNQPSKANDPFANLVPGLGGAGQTSKKDMFKNFEMAKPQPPPRSNPPTSNTGPQPTSNDLFSSSTNGFGSPEPAAASGAPASDFDNYFLNSVGGVPIAEDTANNNTKGPVAAPRNASANDPFGMGDLSAAPAGAASSDSFASNQVFSQPFEFNQNNANSQSLFG